MSEAAPLRATPSSVTPDINSIASTEPESGASARRVVERASPESLAAKQRSNEQDQALIRRVNRGDASAFNDLIVKYEKLVFNFAYRLAENYDDANDIAQEAFVRAYGAIRTFRGDCAFSTWIFRITTNVFLDERKRRKAHPVQSLDEGERQEDRAAVQVEDPGPTPEQIADNKERRRVLVQAIQSLPEYQRAMIVLYHVHQRSYEEIAETMGLPLGTVKSRLNRARLALKEKLRDVPELFVG
jgi:RNA polymerase sigma-70 factor (ECF subfamily)